ncbi:hypothetical protein N658DRAFT_494630 [Parathielavia hyrcaniae]|uniref:Uncharacterized protein n=1 Tax=Parathielavia hyrcaniae TaxID=113614 RepID=A0AAN6T3W5_9PEZI|nr:hypothetical protein N658DRAFT_494630 [Parathielavia hyrcaniae]
MDNLKTSGTMAQAGLPKLPMNLNSNLKLKDKSIHCQKPKLHSKWYHDPRGIIQRQTQTPNVSPDPNPMPSDPNALFETKSQDSAKKGNPKPNILNQKKDIRSESHTRRLRQQRKYRTRSSSAKTMLPLSQIQTPSTKEKQNSIMLSQKDIQSRCSLSNPKFKTPPTKEIQNPIILHQKDDLSYPSIPPSIKLSWCC